ncbi:MAG: beta-galactosidase, partial [Kiritimatiellae bacterium]|nr:beta-galactosidase [Kiritimatiellia bacterium]
RALRTGEVELELLSPGYDGECGRVELLDEAGGLLGSVIIGEDGVFRAGTAAGEQRLIDRISYQNRPINGRFRFQPERWFSLRLGFNCEARIFQAGIVNLYAGYATPGIQWFPLGASLPLAGAGEAIKTVRVKTGPKARLCVDNLCVASPRAAQLNGRLYTVSLREILDLDYLLRTDPPSLWVHSLRNLAGTFASPEIRQAWRRPPTPAFDATARKYETLLIRQALLDERCLALARALFHLQRAGGGERVQAHFASVGALRRAGLNELAGLYGVYAAAWGNSYDERLLDEQFTPAAGRLTDVLDRLDRETEACAAVLLQRPGEALEAPPPMSPGPYDAELVWRDGRFERAGRPVFLYLPVCSGSVGEFRGRLLQLDYCHNIPMVLDDPTRTGRTDSVSFYWPVIEPWIADNLQDPATNSYFMVQSLFGCVHTIGLCPAWWLERHRDDPDIFFQNESGVASTWYGQKQPISRPITSGYYAGGGGYQALLNYWNPDVQAMYRQMLGEWSEHIHARYPDRSRLFLIGWEQSTLAGTTQSGFNTSAIAAFREKLTRKYGSIEALNKAWASGYKDFGEIDQRKVDATHPNGLMYEFQVFRQEGYQDWMRLMSESLKAHMPYVKTLNDYHCLMGGEDYRRMLDVPRMFKTYDIVGHHTYASDKESPVVSRRILDSLKKAYGNPLADFEWGAALHYTDLFREAGYKNSGLLDMFHEMAWGKSVLAVWYGGAPGFSEGCQYYVPQMAGSILRYSSGFMPVGRLRARRFGEIALTYPTMTPPIALMEASATQMNGVDVREVTTEVARSLERDRWNYGFVWEDVLLEGRQSLRDFQTLILVRGVCLRPETTALLVEWVRGGGTLIALLPPGELNQYGQADGRLMRELMPGLDYVMDEQYTRISVTETGGNVREERAAEEGVRVLRRQAGTGEMVLLTQASPYAETTLLSEVNRLTTRDFEAVNGKFWWVARQSPAHLYLFVVNPDFDDTLEDKIRLTGTFGRAVDLGCEKAFPVPTAVEDGRTTFALRLTPAEGTVIRIERVAPAGEAQAMKKPGDP